MIRYLFVILLCTAFPASSEENETLTIDQVVVESVDLAFSNESNTQPELSEFGIQNYVLMSNDLGERWAVVTVKNKASGRRTLTQKHFLAVLANGDRIFPNEFSQFFNRNETMSVTISFGQNKFPILSIYSR
ncbi:hypothetical protein QWZ04_19980 [Vibrio tapetis subsp. quintayensis]|uniref:hypothetical protein n=1 Tax=Vibrio tapetis TaxID=52443 RepID=UPI0025B2FA3B|nr:hypothetical protein [Vibrio tapetis]MDN3682590.1 hypothetical protein [Vibrio tapetis subsp. quintayensis]